MKVVKESINFNKSKDPRYSLNLGELAQIERKYKASHDIDLNLAGLSPNELLKIGIQKNIDDLINYAVKLGADILWYQYSGGRGGNKPIEFPNIFVSLAIVTGARGARVFYDRMSVPGLNSNEGHQKVKASSLEFEFKFAPLNDEIINILKAGIKNANKVIKEYKKVSQ